jgi:hypothetical protein
MCALPSLGIYISHHTVKSTAPILPNVLKCVDMTIIDIEVRI